VLGTRHVEDVIKHVWSKSTAVGEGDSGCAMPGAVVLLCPREQLATR